MPDETPTPEKDAITRLDELFMSAFDTNHPAMLDWVRIRFKLQADQRRAIAAEKERDEAQSAASKLVAALNDANAAHDAEIAQRDAAWLALTKERDEWKQCAEGLDVKYAVIVPERDTLLAKVEAAKVRDELREGTIALLSDNVLKLKAKVAELEKDKEAGR